MEKPVWGASSDHDSMFSKFRLGLTNWCRTGKEPSAGNQDIKYYLDLQEKRLKDRNLSLKLELEPDGEVLDIKNISTFLPVFGKHFAKFQKHLYAQYVTRSAEYSRSGKKIHSQKDFLAMYQTIIDPDPEDENLGSSTYVCPGCGAISTLDTLLNEGCPYCGSRFLMGDLYPKVTNYYYINNGTMSQRSAKAFPKRLLLLSGSISLIQAIYTFFTSGQEYDIPAIPAIGTFLMGIFIWSFSIYFLYSIFLLVRLLFIGAKSLPLLTSTKGSKAKITEKLSPYDPAFDYEYFEGKALSLARIIMFSDDPQSFIQYKGPDISGVFSDIVDIQYRGGIGVRRVKKTDDRIEAELDLYLTNTVDRKNKIKKIDETVRISMYHDAHFPVDSEFSVKKVTCPHCGGSFDASRRKTCPYCNQEYDAGINDWIVTKIKR